MSMSDDAHGEPGLERFFEAARACPPEPSVELMARVMRAAEEVRPAPSAPSRMPWSSRLRDLLGGWPAMAGLATAAAVGLLIGSAGLPEAAAGVMEAEYLVDVAPELAFDLAGGEF